MEVFLVAALTAIVGIRLDLQLTGYPRLGGGVLHITHMLWGGLLMLASIVVLLSFLNKSAHRLAALLGGLGFGAFEIGKFVTEDRTLEKVIAGRSPHRRRHQRATSPAYSRKRVLACTEVLLYATGCSLKVQ